jgi:hypothetical protein
VGIWPIKKRHDLCAWPLNIFLILKGGWCFVHPLFLIK